MGNVGFKTSIFRGISRLEVKQDGEFKSCVNVLCDEYPALRCGVKEEPVITTEKKILTAFPHADSGIAYDSFEGVYSDNQIIYALYGVMGNRAYYQNTCYSGHNIFMLSDGAYDINNYRYYGKGYSDTIAGGESKLIGTLVQSDDGSNITITVNSRSPVRYAGDVYAIRISAAYKDANWGSERLDTFTETETYAAYYVAKSVTNTSTGYKIVCEAFANNGNKFTTSEDYTFDSSDNCYISKKYPALSYLCTHLNRAAGLARNGKDIMLSALGRYRVFYDFSGESTDSYTVTVAEPGEFTGCISYNNTLIVFKRNIMYGLYGDLPENFQLVNISNDIGCIDPKSMCICGSNLYFLGQNGFYRYKGSQPVLISRKLNKRYANAECCSDGVCIYCLCTDEQGEKELLCYDISADIWYELSYRPNRIFCQNGYLHLVYDYKILKIAKGAGEWCIESGNLSDGFFGDRAVTEIHMRVRFTDDKSYINVYTAADDKEFKPHITVSGKGYREFYIPVRFLEGKSYRYKLEGSGECIITDIRRIYSSVEM